MFSKPHILKSIDEIAEEIFAIRLVPEDGEPIPHSPGQFMLLTLPSGTKRAYSIASSPREPFLEFAIKNVNGEFTSHLTKLKEGDKLTVDGPLGPLAYDTCGEYVLIAGGVGITPMLSILRAREGNPKCSNVTLFYSSRTRAGMAYFKELKEIDAHNPKLTSVFTLTRENPEGWEYETGHIDLQMLKKYLTDFEKKKYFVCGPMKMVDAFKEILLKQLKVPEENCTFEGWNV
jgi:3-phenylpropionate/trans-cinnamate dioxygenase ferredoxin reductase subunit